MSETKYGKYIITDLAPKIEAPWAPKFTIEELVHVLYLDSSVVEDAFYVETAWTLPPFAKESRGKTHQHDYDEIIAFFGSDPEHPHELNGIAEVRLGDEIHTVTKSCLIFVPKNVPHGPIDFKRIDKPIFHFTTGPSKTYMTGKKPVKP